MDPNTTKIVLAVVAAVVAAGIVITIKVIRRTTNTSKVTANRVSQKNINTFGDVVGGNKTTK
ncbi:hypothetical protein [Hymenobacter metallicola]|uniref:Uncharacterized protein n=1 Tax=Hymenobacter metallicola TaxID=2563114 RepID=A0A4Z0PY01_9BACT|nr:hypothetical protein [Hymenobacter metallicola]TGE22660.1 hypothetical protein E5K02_23290 [Hymenobacter metallicola]